MYMKREICKTLHFRSTAYMYVKDLVKFLFANVRSKLWRGGGLTNK